MRKSDMVMFDRHSQSGWQQAQGLAIVGDMTFKTLKTRPTWMESQVEFKTCNPDDLEIAEPGYDRSYGRNPYRGYDRSARPFLYNGKNPPHGIPPLVRLVRIGNGPGL